MLRLELRASRTAIRRALARLRDTTPPGWQVRRFNDEGTDFGKGRLWGVSAVAEFVGVYYNKEKFSAMGGEFPFTFEEFEALLAMAKDAGELPIELRNAEGWPALHVYGMVQAAYRPAPEIRAWVFGEPGSTVVTDTELQAAEAIVAWKDAGYFTEGVNGIAWDDSVADLIDGEGVFLIGGDWNTAILEGNMGANVGYFAVPVGPSGVLGGTATLALLWHITAKAEHPDLAAAFIAHMMDADFAHDLASVGRVPDGLHRSQDPRGALALGGADRSPGPPSTLANTSWWRSRCRSIWRPTSWRRPRPVRVCWCARPMWC